MKNKILSVIKSLILALFAVSFSIAVPILWRGFYYLHIKFLRLSESTGFSYDTIKNAFDDMMNYIWRDAPFKTGLLKWSDEGMQHFADCKLLFRFDIYVLIFSFISIVIIFFIERRLKPHFFLKLSPEFWSGIFVIAFFASISLIAAYNFENAFTTFHKLFFPNKTNWIFDHRYDEIILILPIEYFRNCAILAVGLIVLFCIIYICSGLKKSKASG